MIFEGLHENDLDGVLIPVISIDEYHGKIDDESIVVSFFLTDPNAALDLSSFIESGPFEILDSDVSKSINEDGYYQVFIEMERSGDIYSPIKEIIDSIESLSKQIKWSFMTPRTKGEAVRFDQDQLNHYLFQNNGESRPTDNSDESKSMTESLLDFLSNSNAKNVKMINDSIIFSNNHIFSENKFVTFSDANLIGHILGLASKQPNQSQQISENVKKISAILGSDWLVESAGQFITVSSSFSPHKVLLLK